VRPILSRISEYQPCFDRGKSFWSVKIIISIDSLDNENMELCHRSSVPLYRIVRELKDTALRNYFTRLPSD